MSAASYLPPRFADDASDEGRLGAAHHPGHASALLPALDAIAIAHPAIRGGRRLRGTGAVADLLGSGPIHALAASYLGSAARPVRAILFDKSPGANWSLGWHQDRTIAVRERRDAPGFGPWTVKQGILHVAPPFSVIAGLVTLRIHLDDVPADNAPLLIAPGSHRAGLVAEGEIAALVAACGTATCLAQRGDIWAYSTPIVHASAASTAHGHRRVLQVDYAALPLAGGLEWLGV